MKTAAAAEAKSTPKKEPSKVPAALASPAPPAPPAPPAEPAPTLTPTNDKAEGVEEAKQDDVKSNPVPEKKEEVKVEPPAEPTDDEKQKIAAKKAEIAKLEAEVA